MMKYRVIQTNATADEGGYYLDAFSSTDLDTAAEELANLLANKSWVLYEGDIIRVVAV